MVQRSRCGLNEHSDSWSLIRLQSTCSSLVHNLLTACSQLAHLTRASPSPLGRYKSAIAIDWRNQFHTTKASLWDNSQQKLFPSRVKRQKKNMTYNENHGLFVPWCLRWHPITFTLFCVLEQVQSTLRVMNNKRQESLESATEATHTFLLRDLRFSYYDGSFYVSTWFNDSD